MLSGCWRLLDGGVSVRHRCYQFHDRTVKVRIAEAKGDWQSEIRIKAKVLLDYVDTAEGDAVHQLASLLCKAVLALQVVSRN